MSVRRLVVLSGFDTRFAEKTRSSFKAQQVGVVFSDPSKDTADRYFEVLTQKVREFIDRHPAESGDRVIGLLISCFVDERSRTVERAAFFPSFRRMGFPSSYRADINRAAELVRAVIRCLTSEEFLGVYEHVKPRANPILALPLRNAGSRRLTRLMAELYETQTAAPVYKLDKEIARRRRGPGFRINDLDFVGRTNDPKHPVRRCTDSVGCDVSARLRLGFALPSRFEFDVSSQRGIGGRRFILCDDSVQSAPLWATHVNMRINDDHAFGR